MEGGKAIERGGGGRGGRIEVKGMRVGGGKGCRERQIDKLPAVTWTDTAMDSRCSLKLIVNTHLRVHTLRPD